MSLTSPLDPTTIFELRNRVIEWYKERGDKLLPWRLKKDAWTALLASLLLRRTRAERAAELFQEVLARLPSPREAAEASEEELRGLLRPLGLQNLRAKEIIEIARLIIKRWGGSIPCSGRALAELPGVGRYSASMILMAACERPEPLLDSNAARVIGRLFGVDVSRGGERKLEALVRLLAPQSPEAKEFTLGLIDLGRKICRARAPVCHACPLRDLCRYASRTRRS